MNDLLKVSANSHVRSKATTSNIMLDVIVALLPASIFGVYNFGIRALAIIILCILACVISEEVYARALGKKSTIKDLSAVVTGLLLALNLPSTVPFWLPVIGGVFAIIVVKQVFGGIGQNFMNPALAARCFLLISYTGRMTDFTYKTIDAVTTATPLAQLRMGEAVDVMDMFIGTIPGVIGETSVIAILIGGLYLLARRVINYRIPVIYLVSFSLFILLFGGHGFDVTYLTAQLCGGGLMLGAFFMATDYTTSPITAKGQIVYAIILGLLTGIFRILGSSPEGVSYAIIIGNILKPLIEKVTYPKAFGKGGKKA